MLAVISREEHLSQDFQDAFFKSSVYEEIGLGLKMKEEVVRFLGSLNSCSAA